MYEFRVFISIAIYNSSLAFVSLLDESDKPRVSWNQAAQLSAERPGRDVSGVVERGEQG